MTKEQFIRQYKERINQILPEFRQKHFINDDIKQANKILTIINNGDNKNG